MTALSDTSFLEHAARYLEPKQRQWATPGALAKALDPQTRDSMPLRIIDRELTRLADHQVPADALAIYMSPQEGKARGSAAGSRNGCWPTIPHCGSRLFPMSRKWRRGGVGRSSVISAMLTRR